MKSRNQVVLVIAALLLLGLSLGGIAAWFARREQPQPEVVAGVTPPAPQTQADQPPQIDQPDQPKVPTPANVVETPVPDAPKDPEVKVVPRTPKTGKPAVATPR